jgi:hypothetical protein
MLNYTNSLVNENAPYLCLQFDANEIRAQKQLPEHPPISTDATLYFGLF